MAGKLYLCATPIGNLEDITFRTLETLKAVDLIAAEDTRHSIKLLNHFDIKTKMTSYHEYNRVEKARYLVKLLEDGKNIALITDAGTPGISDPGEELVRQCHENGIQVTSLPGACALINGLIISGQPTRRFCFEAFLPPDKKERAMILEQLKDETRTIILYEAPHRLLKTLEELYSTMGNRKMTVCRELTKKHETVFVSEMEEVISYYTEHPAKGECSDHSGKNIGGTEKGEPGAISGTRFDGAYGTLFRERPLTKRGYETGGQRPRSRKKRYLSGASPV